jgi:hypothetical protein
MQPWTYLLAVLLAGVYNAHVTYSRVIRDTAQMLPLTDKMHLGTAPVLQLVALWGGSRVRAPSHWEGGCPLHSSWASRHAAWQEPLPWQELGSHLLVGDAIQHKNILGLTSV